MTKIRPQRQRHSVHHQAKHQTTKKDDSKLKDHQIEHKTSFFDSTMGKVVAIAMIVLVIITPIVGFGYYMMSNQSSQAAVAPIHYTAIPPQYEEPVVPHEYFARGFVRPEKWTKNSNQKTTYSCTISPTLEELKTCNQNAEFIYSELHTMPEVTEAIQSDEVFHNDGFALEIDNALLAFGVNSMIRRNHEAALKIIEDEVLSTDFVEGDIEATIKKVHTTLVKDLKNSAGEHLPIPGGTYRTHEMIVQFDNRAHDHTLLKELVEERNGKGTYHLFLKALGKIDTGNRDSLTTTEQNILKSVVDIPPSPEDLPKQMELFVREYRQKLLNKEHPFVIAAWVHMQLVNIHSFEDAHGRLARIFMNAELKRGGYLPIVILDNTDYSQAIKKDQKNPGTFANYLASIYPTSQQLDKLSEFPDWKKNFL